MSLTNEQTLLPCPFCAGEVEVAFYHPDMGPSSCYVKCWCGARGTEHQYHHGDSQEAIVKARASWNRRSSPEPGCEWCDAPTHGTAKFPWQANGIRCTAGPRHHNITGSDPDRHDCSACGAWAIFTAANRQPEPSEKPDPLVQCVCGWLGKTSDLTPSTFGQGKVCPKCAASFRSVGPYR